MGVRRYSREMAFGVGKRKSKAPAFAAVDEGLDHASTRPGVGVPPDFMRSPEWSSLVADVVHGHMASAQLARLPRRDRDYIYRVVSHLDSPISADQANRWYNQTPSGVTAGLVGAAKARDARRIRAGRRVFDMSAPELDRYNAILADVESFLLNACAHYPDSLLPWVPRIDAARGLRLGHDEVLRRFAEAQARERWNFLAVESTFKGLTPAWQGSYQAVFEFAADVVLGTPPGHPARAVAAYAEAERIVRDRNLALSAMPARENLDFQALFGAYVRALPDVLDPDDVVGLGAFLFVVAPRDAAEARITVQALELLQRRCGGYPYTELKDPVAWFDRIVATRDAEATALLE